MDDFPERRCHWKARVINSDEYWKETTDIESQNESWCEIHATKRTELQLGGEKYGCSDTEHIPSHPYQQVWGSYQSRDEVSSPVQCDNKFPLKACRKFRVRISAVLDYWVLEQSFEPSQNCTLQCISPPVVCTGTFKKEEHVEDGGNVFGRLFTGVWNGEEGYIASCKHLWRIEPQKSGRSLNYAWHWKVNYWDIHEKETQICESNVETCWFRRETLCRNRLPGG